MSISDTDYQAIVHNMGTNSDRTNIQVHHDHDKHKHKHKYKHKKRQGTAKAAIPAKVARPAKVAKSQNTLNDGKYYCALDN